jgi:hypothetical protein
MNVLSIVVLNRAGSSFTTSPLCGSAGAGFELPLPLPLEHAAVSVMAERAIASPALPIGDVFISVPPQRAAPICGPQHQFPLWMLKRR